MRRRFIYSLVLFILLACATARAEAHAIILESSPIAGATVPAEPILFKLRFNSRIDHARSVLTLFDGEKHETKLAISPQSSTEMLEATTAALAPGDYRVRWQVLSVDGHITRGDIPFTVQ
jgi:methionine-rich copper-binding protein CopC